MHYNLSLLFSEGSPKTNKEINNKSADDGKLLDAVASVGDRNGKLYSIYYNFMICWNILTCV